MFWGRLRYWCDAFMTIWVNDRLTDLQTGEILCREAPGDAVLVIGGASADVPSDKVAFDSVSWSCAWINFLEQECGGRFSVVHLNRLMTGYDSAERLIIITSSATSETPSQRLLRRLEHFVESGGCVILETPTPAWRHLSGGTLCQLPVNVNASGARSLLLHCERFPHAPRDAQPRQGELRLAEAPLFSYVHDTVGTEPGTAKRGRILDVPALWQRPIGHGWVITLAFDVGFYLQAMQQGVPTIGWKVNEISGLLPGLVESQDLCLSRDITDNDQPYADMFEDWLAEYCDGAMQAWPRWWRFPYDYDGVLALTHDEENLGPQSCEAMWKLEQDLQVRSTLFAVCSDAQDGQRWRDFSEPYHLRAGGEIPSVSWGLHWNRLWPHIALQHQKRWLETGCGTIRFNRIHYLLWGRDYTAPLRHMAHHGIVLDSSYGPNRGKGYIFGTGLPFHTLDKNGLPLPLWEWPLVAQECWSHVDSDYIEDLLRQSANQYHQAPVVLLHPHRWLSTPEGRQYLRSIVASARRYKHWIANFEEYWQFTRNRARAVMTSHCRGRHLQVKLFAPQEGMGIVLPGRAQNIRINAEETFGRSLRLNGTNHWLVAVPQGESYLSAYLPE